MIRNPKTIEFWMGRLPHWEVEDGRYFVTIHLSGAIPKRGRDQIHNIAAELSKFAKQQLDERLKIQRKIFAEMESWLDSCEYKPLLRNEKIAQILVDAIETRTHKEIWQMFQYVIMPNHIHMFFELIRGRLKFALEDFKTWTGRQSGSLVHLDGKRFWQREWFDHWSRSDDEDDRIIEYIRQNPVKAKLVRSYLEWQWGSW